MRNPIRKRCDTVQTLSKSDYSVLQYSRHIDDLDILFAKTRDLWYHEAGCGRWLVVRRNTLTHEVLGAELALAHPKAKGASA